MTIAKQKTLINFKKAHSLISKIIEMVGSDMYCVDIMQQNLAAIGLLRSAHEMLMENHLNTCFRETMKKKNKKNLEKKEKMIQEVLKVTKLFNR